MLNNCDVPIMGGMDLLKLEVQNNFAQDLTFSSLDFSLILLTSFLCPTTLHCVSFSHFCCVWFSVFVMEAPESNYYLLISSKLSQKNLKPLILFVIKSYTFVWPPFRASLLFRDGMKQKAKHSAASSDSC